MLRNYNLKFAELSDLTSWMELVMLVRDNFPGLETEKDIDGYKQTVIKNINRKTAICVTDEDSVIGVLIFSYNQCCLSCMAVHPEYRRKGIATAMIDKMLVTLPSDKDVVVNTFRANDEKGTAPRALYKQFGFLEDELIMEFNYPHQKFILHRIKELF